MKLTKRQIDIIGTTLVVIMGLVCMVMIFIYAVRPDFK